jgi:hypothetical protein
MLSIYFYCQHYRVVKKYQMDEEFHFSGLTVVIKEIEIDEFRPDSGTAKMQNSFSGPWYFKYAEKLPPSLRAPFLKACYFYSTPYQLGGTGTLRLKGMLLFNGGSPCPEGEIWEGLDIYLYDEDMRYYGRLRETMRNSLSNYSLFSVTAKNAPLNKKAYKIIVKDKCNDDLRSFVMHPQWVLATYTIFDRRIEQYPFDPFNIIQDGFLTPMRQGHKEEARRRLQPGAGEEGLWATLDHGYWAMGGTDYVSFEGSHGGFEGVYASNVVFGHYQSGYAPEDLIPVAGQKIFFVIEKGSPLIIGADPAGAVQKNSFIGNFIQ